MKCTDWRVLVTGASSGIGRATAELFAKEGAKLLLMARSEDKLAALSKEFNERYGVEVHYVSVDVQQRSAVEAALTGLPEAWQAIDVLVNNAGLALGLEKLHEGNVDQWEQMIDTNVKGVLYISRHVVGKMLARNKGHIINIGSVSAHQVYSGGVVYCATKFALRAITDGIKMDVHGTPIRTTSIDPGMVETQFSVTRFSGDQAKADSVYQGLTPLRPEDIADAVVYAATRPAHVDVREMLIMPTAQTAAHLTHRE
ncbi:MAG: SDR family NAD(P)-dependent oxidoreductase [Coxiellaceae bacterium]|nr:SDR family NAD(P)-dependent oxidoreductase [Coxiellaceae bacterium]